MSLDQLQNTILNEALLLFEQRGVAGLEESEIPTLLNISPSTYRDIAKNKKDLFISAYKMRLAEQRIVQQEIINKADTAISALIDLLSNSLIQAKNISPVFLSDLARTPEVMSLIAEEIANYSTPLYKSLLNRGIREKVFRHDINIEIVTKVIMENANLLLDDRIFPGDRYPLGEVIRSVFMYYFRGLCTAEHIAMVDEYFSRVKWS